MTARLSEVPSPCIGVCYIEPRSGLCRGCRRSLEEISDWLEMTPEQKLATLQRVTARNAGLGEL